MRYLPSFRWQLALRGALSWNLQWSWHSGSQRSLAAAEWQRLQFWINVAANDCLRCPRTRCEFLNCFAGEAIGS